MKKRCGETTTTKTRDAFPKKPEERERVRERERERERKQSFISWARSSQVASPHQEIYIAHVLHYTKLNYTLRFASPHFTALFCKDF